MKVHEIEEPMDIITSIVIEKDGDWYKIGKGKAPNVDYYQIYVMEAKFDAYSDVGINTKPPHETDRGTLYLHRTGEKRMVRF